jgi:hypothetical protein
LNSQAADLEGKHNLVNCSDKRIRQSSQLGDVVPREARLLFLGSPRVAKNGNGLCTRLRGELVDPTYERFRARNSERWAALRASPGEADIGNQRSVHDSIVSRANEGTN